MSGMPGRRWLHTPGHTPGQVALFRDEDGIHYCTSDSHARSFLQST